MPRREFGINAVAADSSPALTEVVCTSGGTVRDIQSQLSHIIWRASERMESDPCKRPVASSVFGSSAKYCTSCRRIASSSRPSTGLNRFDLQP